MFGTSHGGYLAFLCSKIAPFLIDSVVDNSSYTRPLFRLYGFGKYFDFVKHSEFSTNDFFQNILIYASSKTPFSLNKQDKFYFSKACFKMRNLNTKEHFKTWLKHSKTTFISYHSLYDEYVKLKPKLDLCKSLNATLHAITKTNQTFKSLKHGLCFSMKAMLKKHLNDLLELKPSQSQAKSISYKCDNLTYKFKISNNKMTYYIKKDPQ